MCIVAPLHNQQSHAGGRYGEDVEGFIFIKIEVPSRVVEHHIPLDQTQNVPQ